jgi:dephospho-CoA kinase
MKQVANIGITGGIGSGKSYVCALLKAKGVRVFEADARAKEILNSSESVKSKVKALLGEDSYFDDGTANRSKIASRVFTNPDLLKALNAILHPETISDFERWKSEVPAEYPWSYQVKEAAILFESGTDKGLDAIVTVSAPEELRIARVMERDHISREQVLDRIQKQLPEAERIRRSDYILLNDGSVNVEEETLHLHQTLENRFGS